MKNIPLFILWFNCGLIQKKTLKWLEIYNSLLKMNYNFKTNKMMTEEALNNPPPPI